MKSDWAATVPPTRTTGDTPTGGVAADMNLVRAVLTEIRANVPNVPGDVAAAAASHTHAATDLASGIVPTARLGSGTASSSTFLRGDQTWAAPPTGGGSATETVHTITASGSAQTLNPTVTGTYKKVTLTANCTFTFAGATAGQVTRMDVELVENGTGGWTVTWPSSVKWPGGGGAPPIVTTAGSVSAFTFWSSDGSTWLGAAAGIGFA